MSPFECIVCNKTVKSILLRDHKCSINDDGGKVYGCPRCGGIVCPECIHTNSRIAGDLFNGDCARCDVELAKQRAAKLKI